MISHGYLAHHGIKGQKWGVRRYQNADGSLTSAGKERYMYANRARRALKTKADMDRLYNTLSKLGCLCRKQGFQTHSRENRF